MIKRAAILFLSILIFSCSSKDTQFCECLSTGETLNEYTQQFFDKSPSEKERAKLIELKSAKEEACKDYQTMAGEEMRVKKEACESN